MRILHLFYEPLIAGITRSVLDIAGGLPHLQHAAVISSADPRLAEAFAAAGVPATVVAPARTFSLGGLLAARRSPRPDLLHLHNLHTALWGQAAGLVCRRPVVFTPHVERLRRSWVNEPFRWLWRETSRPGSVLVALTPEQRQQFLAWRLARPKQVVVVPNGIDPARCPALGETEQAEVRRRLGAGPEDFLVLQVGRLDAQKDPLTGLAAAALLKDRGVPCRWVFVGEGPQHKALHDEAARLRLSRTVCLAGFVPAGPALAAADLVVLTSLWEGLPFTLLEAGALGRPAVASDLPGTRAVLGENEGGLLVPPQEAQAFAQAVESLWRDPLRRKRLGAAARLRIAQHFTLERTLPLLEAAYRQAAGRS